MALIRRTWTPKEAEEWTKEDWYTVILSPLIYFLFTIGIAMACLFMTAGIIMVVVAVLLTLLMVYIINPKLTAVSDSYEKKQKQYLEELEQKVKWEEGYDDYDD